MNGSSKLWAGRFSESTNSIMETFSESVSIDHRLYSQDISGSIAHARMLSKCGIISEPEFKQIRGGLMRIQEAIEDGSFEW